MMTNKAALKVALVWGSPLAVLLLALALLGGRLETIIPLGLRPSIVTLGVNPILRLFFFGLAACGLLSFALWVAVYHSPKGDAGDDVVAQNRHLWLAFALTCIVILFFIYNNYLVMQSRVAMVRGDLALFVASVTASRQIVAPPVTGPIDAETEREVRALDAVVNDGLRHALNLGRSLAAGGTVSDTAAFQATLLALDRDSVEGALAARRAHALAQQLLPHPGPTETAGATFAPLAATTSEVVSLTEQISNATAALMVTARDRPAQDTFALRVQAGKLAGYFSRLQGLVEAIINSLPAMLISATGPFFLVTSFETLLILFPWLILTMFILRKREYQVRAKAKVLRELNLAEDFLALTLGAGDPAAGTRTEDQRLEQAVRLQAFRDSEYAVSLLVLTVIIAVFWHYIFYPREELGLAQWLAEGQGIRAFTGYLAANLTPLTAGFAGGYFFTVQMLLRRYLSGDLNPKVYVYVIVRMLIVFILSLLFSVVEAASLPGVSWDWAILATFLVGIVPTTGIRWILNLVAKGANVLPIARIAEDTPLTDLEGLSTWDEARLQEENVQNAQNLATSSLTDLFVHTNYSSKQLVDWVDQALLHIHAVQIHADWNRSLKLVGIRTATDLLDCICEDGDQPNWSQKVCQDNATRVAKAISDAIDCTQASRAKARAELPAPVPVDVLLALAETIYQGPNILRIRKFWRTHRKS